MVATVACRLFWLYEPNVGQAVRRPSTAGHDAVELHRGHPWVASGNRHLAFRQPGSQVLPCFLAVVVVPQKQGQSCRKGPRSA